jgi:hypothetical protein
MSVKCWIAGYRNKSFKSLEKMIMKRFTKIFPVYVMALLVLSAPAVIQNWALAEYETCHGKVVEVENPVLRAVAERSEMAKWLNRVDLICPLAGVTGPVEIMDCYAAGDEITFSPLQWQIRHYESVQLLVPTEIMGIS